MNFPKFINFFFKKLDMTTVKTNKNRFMQYLKPLI